jgi:very-short-patch-repair endonuclease
VAEFAHAVRKETRPPLARERALAALASRPRGIVAATQLYALGFDPAWISRAVARGRLIRLHRGVYAVGHAALTRQSQLLAAVLACGPGAVGSHRSAAAAYRLLPSWPDEPEVTVAANRSSRPGIRTHRARRLERTQTTRRDGIPVTTPARTILDLAETASPTELELALAEGEALRVVYRSTVAAELQRTPGRRGARALRALLAQDRVARTRSELERDFLALIRRTDVPEPEMNAWLLGFQVDGLWPEARLVLELDSYRFHGTRKAFEDDRRRDTALQIAGYRVIRVTSPRLDRPEALIADLRALRAT